MKFRKILPLILILAGLSCSGCAKKADPNRPIETVRKEAATMSLEELQVRASDYAAAIRQKKAEIQKIQAEIQKMPVDKVFDNKSMARHIVGIGREGEALFERYKIYAQAFQEKGGDFAKIQLEPSKS